MSGLRGRLARAVAGTGVGTLLAATIGVLLALAVVGIGLALRANNELTRQRTVLLDEVGPSLRAALQLENGLVNEETGVRGFVLTGQSVFVQPYRSGAQAVTAAYHELKLRDPSLGARILADVAATRLHVESWQHRYVAPALSRPGRFPRRPLAVELEGKRMFDSIRVSLRALQSDLQARDNLARSRLNRAASGLRGLLILAAVLILGGVLAAGALLRSTITQPLGRLGREARRVASGEFSRPLDTIGGAREISEVGGELDAMRARIVAELEATRDARAQLQQQAVELQRSNAELEQFAYVASHDLQEPLRKVASFCQALQQRYGGQLDARADQYIEFAVDGAKRMQTLINELLVFSRVGRGGAGEQRKPLELRDALDDALAALDSALDSSGAKVQIGELPRVVGERPQLASLFQNLIGNAVKFRGEQAPLVRIEAVRREREWELSVADNGIGIDPQYGERIFLIFQRLHTRERYDGSGIGLAICRKIVECHSGRIWLDPNYRDGACFRFTLPIAEEEN
ncbi:MAG TPA: ATP-binding protein [Solirubrobacteraceae bacterium]|nr:ATP-binding protein [Solirubrobacteraceae bacterium]